MESGVDFLSVKNVVPKTPFFLLDDILIPKYYGDSTL
jgi:hypothetical protein